jgi:hypothetical protein
MATELLTVGKAADEAGISRQALDKLLFCRTFRGCCGDGTFIPNPSRKLRNVRFPQFVFPTRV